MCMDESQWSAAPSGGCVHGCHVALPLPLPLGPLVQLIHCCSHGEGLAHTVTHGQCKAKVLLLMLEGKVGLKVTSQHGCRGRVHSSVSELPDLSAAVLVLPDKAICTKHQ